ncbi:MAG: hypothetical protein JKX73_08020 [Flavobacteriales bacterium]|nr:hypothetical protein [Flavobacteriales bacterium]
MFCLVISQIGCDSSDTAKEVVKLHPNDPFREEMVESQFFDLSTKEDTVIEGKNGTVIMIPKGAFKDENGKVVKGNIKLELAEPTTADELMLSNLTSNAGDKTLDSKGILYLNATADGRPLRMNEKRPIYVEIPAGGNEKDVQLYKGVRGEDGRMYWENPESIAKFLMPVDLSTLDFLPDGFREEVASGLPFRSYKESTPELVDSLYYSFYKAGYEHSERGSFFDNLEHAIAEALYELQDDAEPYIEDLSAGDTSAASEAIEPVEEAPRGPCGIDPAIIKVIRDKKFENTLIATREFEKRLRVIFSTCNDEVLEIYIENLDKDLWELDEMAAEELEELDISGVFQDFAAEKLTNVKKNKSAKKLAKFYKRKLSQVKKDLAKIEDKARKQVEKEDRIAEEDKKDYNELLVKREKYRMDKFGFELKEFGWYNAASDVYVYELDTFILEITVNKGDEYDRVHTYVLNPKIKSLFAMISEDNVFFGRGYDLDKWLLMELGQDADVVVVAYLGEDAFYGKQGFVPDKDVPSLLTFDLKKMNKDELRKLIRKDNWSTKENKIMLDLDYQAKFYKEQLRQKRLKDERRFMQGLFNIVYPCCEYYYAA